MARGHWLTKLRTWAMSQDRPDDGGYDFEHGRKALSADLWSLGIGAAVAGYFAADYLAFAPAIDRAAFGLYALVAIYFVHQGVSARVKWKRIVWLLPVLLVLLASLFFVSDYMDTLSDTVEAGERRCAQIQDEMLAAHPRRDDLPEIFAALGCRPYGGEDISFLAQARK